MTEVRFAGIPRGEFLAYASVVLDGCLAVKSIAVLRRRTGDGILLAMPQREGKDGQKVDVAHPICPRFRVTLEKAVLAAYREQVGDPAAVVARENVADTKQTNVEIH